MVSTRSRRNYNVTFALLVLAVVSYSLLQSLVLPALPEIQQKLGVSVSSASWILTAFLLSASIATPLFGRLGDMYGKARVLVVVLVGLCLGTLISAVASSLATMLVGRVIQGMAGGLFPLAFGIIRDEFPREKVAGAVGFISALSAVGAGAGLVLTGPIVDSLSYHYLFWLSLIPMMLAAVTIRLYVPESKLRVPAPLNVSGAVLMASGLTALLLAVTQSPSWGWLSLKTLALLTLGALFIARWTVNEARSASPLVDMRMMRLRSVWTTNAVAFLVGFAMYSIFILLPSYVETPARAGYGFGVSTTVAGLFLAPTPVAALLFGAQTGRLERRFGSKRPLLAGIAFTMVAYAWLALAPTEEWEFFACTSLIGAGIGLAFAAMVNLIIESVGPAQTGVATAMNTVTRYVGGAFGGAAIASILAAGVQTNGFPSNTRYTMAFWVLVAALALATFVGLGIPTRAGAPTSAAETVSA
jgi:EmrB/QacA subfamily drug resistance transporter